MPGGRQGHYIDQLKNSCGRRLKAVHAENKRLRDELASLARIVIARDKEIERLKKVLTEIADYKSVTNMMPRIAAIWQRSAQSAIALAKGEKE